MSKRTVQAETDGTVTDLLIAGLPSALLHWTSNLIWAAASLRFQATTMLSVTTEARWTPADSANNAAIRIFVGDLINEAWQVTLKDAQFPILFVMDDVVSAIAYLVEAGQTYDQAVRNLVAVATSMGDIVCSKNVLILYRSDFQNDPEIGSRILGHAGLWREPAEDPLLQLVRSSIDDLDGLLTEPASIPQSLQNLTKTVLAPSIHYGCTGQRVPVVWPRDCLYWGDQPGLPLPRVLELTGPARVLVYGPYYVLPVGTWRIRVTLAVSASACKTPLALELHGAAELARFQFSVDQPGLFVASMVITIRSAREPLECRLTVLRGAIEGQLGLDRIEFTPEPG